MDSPCQLLLPSDHYSNGLTMSIAFTIKLLKLWTHHVIHFYPQTINAMDSPCQSLLPSNYLSFGLTMSITIFRSVCFCFLVRLTKISQSGFCGVFPLDAIQALFKSSILQHLKEAKITKYFSSFGILYTVHKNNRVSIFMWN